jgi:hypothetical protein
LLEIAFVQEEVVLGNQPFTNEEDPPPMRVGPNRSRGTPVVEVLGPLYYTSFTLRPFRILLIYIQNY